MESTVELSEPQALDLFTVADTTMVISFVAAFFFLLFMYRRNKPIRSGILRGAVVMGTGLVIIFSLIVRGDDILIAIFAGIVAMTITDFLFFRSKKRISDISRSERRKVIAAFESQRGKKFDPKRHTIAYIIPASEGGKPTADNLRVQRKKERSKAHWWELLD